MIIDDYRKAIDELFARVNETQTEAIIAAGKMMADAMCEGRMIHIFDSGHIINSEMTQRSGGLLAPKMLRYYLKTESDGRPRPANATKNRSMECIGEMVFNSSEMCDGDVLIVGSVSGRNDQVVDIALNAKRKHNCQLIALTSLEYSSNVKSMHSSGLRLFEFADIVLDNCAPLGDGMLNIPGVPMPFAPASGLSACYIMWQVYCACLEEMLARGKTPSVLKSSNTPGGDEYNLEMEHRFAELGY